MVAIGKHVLLIDVNKVHAGTPPGGLTVEKPIMCHMNNLLEGVCLIGEHDEDVTDLAMPLYISSHVASASLDGLVSLSITLLLIFKWHTSKPVSFNSRNFFDPVYVFNR